MLEKEKDVRDGAGVIYTNHQKSTSI